MSRHRAFSYEIEWPTFCEQAAIEKLFDDHAGIFPERNCQGGALGPEAASIFLWANRAKARRIARRLDRHLGRECCPGALIEWEIT